MHIRIAGFGMSQVADMTTTVGITRETAHGLTWYTAPELIEEAAKTNYASDVWAFGCLCLLVSESVRGLALHPSMKFYFSTLDVLTRCVPPSDLDWSRPL